MRLPFNGSFAITQRFGVNPAAYAQFGMKGHNGLDYGLPTGTAVVAAISGTVQVLSDPPGFGNYVTVTNGQYKTIYAHLSAFKSHADATVKAGDVIGLSGNTGNSTGPHLHFGVKPTNPDNNNGFFGAIDPQPLINQGDEMYNGQTAEFWAKAANNATMVATAREDYLNKIAYAEGSGSGAIEEDDVKRIIAGIDRRNREIESLKAQIGTTAIDLKPGVYRVK